MVLEAMQILPFPMENPRGYLVISQADMKSIQLTTSLISDTTGKKKTTYIFIATGKCRSEFRVAAANRNSNSLEFYIAFIIRQISCFSPLAILSTFGFKHGSPPVAGSLAGPPEILWKNR